MSVETNLRPGKGFLSGLTERLNALSPEKHPPHHGRVLSVDALWGFDMLWITGGGVVFLRLNDAVQSPLTSTIARQLDHVP